MTAFPKYGLMGAVVVSTNLAAFTQEGIMNTRTWNFDGDATGAVAGGFSGEVGDWKVVKEELAASTPNVLAQLATNEKAIYNVALVKEVRAKDLDMSVKFRSIAGQIDRGGGVVWRAKDAKNYYIARYNPLEANFRVYKVVDGKRTELGSANVEPSEGWHGIRVSMTGDQIECHYDGKKSLEAKDSAFPEAGQIGLWTKADAQTQFDDLTLQVK